MINFPLIGLAAGLVLCAFVVKVFKHKPEKASKSDKAEIMKQLLALSEDEIRIPARKPVSGARPSMRNQSKSTGNPPRPKQQTVVPAMRSAK